MREGRCNARWSSLPVALAMSCLLSAGAAAQSDSRARSAGATTAQADPYAAEAELIESALSRWKDGTERQKLRAAQRTLTKNLAEAQASLTAAGDAVAAMDASVERSGIVPRLGRIEAEVTEAQDRLRARWERDQAARDRERQQREREAAERARSRP